MTRPVCVVAGVGPGNGASLARRFAAEGHAVALLARRHEHIDPLAAELPAARAYPCDVSDPAAVATTFAEIGRDLGPVDTLVYNAGSGTWGTIEEVSPADFEASWRVNTLGLLVATQAVIPAMKARGAGNIVVIGATASLRGRARTTAFAAAKAAQRSLAQSMGRHLWPLGVHVSLVIIDGVVDLPSTRARMPDAPDEFFVQPDDVAASVLAVTRQPRSAWSFEVEVRPFGETW